MLELWYCTVTSLRSGLIRNLLNANCLSDLSICNTAVGVKGAVSNYFLIENVLPLRIDPFKSSFKIKIYCLINVFLYGFIFYVVLTSHFCFTCGATMVLCKSVKNFKYILESKVRPEP